MHPLYGDLHLIYTVRDGETPLAYILMIGDTKRMSKQT